MHFVLVFVIATMQKTVNFSLVHMVDFDRKK